ncbi:MAG: hypothetical protein AAF668_13315 [Pseudomonadota bacterium]
MALGVLSLSGCTNPQRFLPGGIVKVRDLAKGRPVNPELADEMAATEEAAKKAPFPKLGNLPQEPASKRSAEIVRSQTAEIVDAGNALKELIDADRSSAADERRAYEAQFDGGLIDEQNNN